MAATTTHFRVGNGDMTLVELESGRTILIDIRIRADADDPDGEAADVAAQLRSRRVRREQSVMVIALLHRCFFAGERRDILFAASLSRPGRGKPAQAVP